MRFYVAGNNRDYPVIDVADKHSMGIELQEFATPDLLDGVAINDIEVYQTALRNISERSIHGPFSELFPGSRDSLVRKLAADRFRKAHELAVQLKARHLILHNAYIPVIHNPEDWLTHSVIFWRELTEELDGSVEIHIENTYEYDHVLMRELIDTVDRAFFSACLDVGHCNAFSKQPIHKWIEELGDRIGYIHLHNNNGAADEHAGLLKGTIHMDAVIAHCETRLNRAVLSIEVQPEDFDASISWLKEKGFL